MKKKSGMGIGIAAVLLAFFACGLYNGLQVTQYTAASPKIEQPLRIVLLSDMHSCYYGEDARELVSAVKKQQPDLVLLCGDIFDDGLPDDHAEALVKALGGRYPCYYVTGNHEYWSGSKAYKRKMDILAANHVERLDNEAVTVNVRGTELNLCGMNDPEACDVGEAFTVSTVLEDISRISYNGKYTILLSHRPELFESYCEYPFDLVLAGHAHGGQWRLPFLTNGVYAPNQGLFPKWAAGMFGTGEPRMIVSRGLSKESTRIPRFCNRPELVVIDLVPQT